MKKYHSSIIGIAHDDQAAGNNPIVFVCQETVNFIANDSDTHDLLLNFDYTVDGVGAIILKPGEILSDLRINCQKIYVKGLGGSVPYRALGA